MLHKGILKNPILPAYLLTILPIFRLYIDFPYDFVLREGHWDLPLHYCAHQEPCRPGTFKIPPTPGSSQYRQFGVLCCP